MDDLGEKISQLLSDPDGMARIRQMAESVLGENQSTTAVPDLDIGRIIPLIQKMKSRGTDNRTGLLLALRPHLSQKRQERLDKAVKILRVIDMLPFLQESGIFNL